MRYWVSLLLALTLAALGCGDEGGCTAPLDAFSACSDGCPTYEEVAGSSVWVDTGECLGFRYVFVGGLSPKVWFFDAGGTLQAVQVMDDVPSFCDRSSYFISYGPVPSCDADACGRFWCEEGHWLRP